MTSVTMTDFIIGFVVFIITYVIYKFIRERNGKSPPGPWGLPIVGYIPFLGTNTAKTLMELSKIYGNVMRVKIGSWNAIVLSGHDVIREATINQGNIFVSRPHMKSFQIFRYGSEQENQALSKYHLLYELKRKTSSESLKLTLRNRETPIDDVIVAEANDLAHKLIEMGKNGTPIGETEEIRLSASSSMYDIIYGKVVDGNVRENKGFLEFLERFDAIEASLAGPVDMMPWTEIFCKEQMNTARLGWKLYEATVGKLHQLHMTSYDPNDLRDTYDTSIKISRNLVKEYNLGLEGKIKDWHLSYAVHDLFIAAVETTSTTMKWAILYLIGYPEIQEKLHNEIKKVLGERKPTLDDIKEIPYTEAYILEIIRHSNVVPLWIPYSNLENAQLEGYFIPKDSFIFMNAYSINMSDEIWKNPTEFNPERFLTETNEIDRSLANKIAAFGFGKRRCPGEQIAKFQLFLLNVVLLQKCSFSNVEGQKLCFEGIDGHTHRPMKYEFLVRPRH